MARHHGRNARVYLAITSAGTAEPIPGVNAWSIQATTDKVDVTAFGDTNKQYVAGLPDASGTFGGWWDDTSKQTLTAALDGVARKAYFYEDITANPTSYWYGNVLPDFSESTGVGDAVSFTASWNASGTVQHS